MKNIFKYSFLLFAGLVFVFSSCKKSYLDKSPTNQVPIDDVFKTTESAKAALEGLNSKMFELTSDQDQFGQKSIDLMLDLMGEDMPISDIGDGHFWDEYTYVASRTPSSNGAYVWTFYYSIINNANQIITRIDNAEGPDADKQNIKGQALFYRAFALYNLSIMYQHTYVGNQDKVCVPIYTEPTREGNPRATVEEVYTQIKNDLDNSMNLLQQSGEEREDKSQINTSVVEGLYARVALVMQDWTKARDMAIQARTGFPIMSMSQTLEGFNDWGNPEWIWASRIPEGQTNNLANFFSSMDPAGQGYAIAMQKTLYKPLKDSALSNSDIRNGWWYSAASGIYLKYCQKKFRMKSSGAYATDQCYMRSSEMALIEAEARANLNDIAGADLVMNELISQNRDTAFVPSTSKNQLLRQIYFQRRIELWGEGFRFGDIQRQAATTGFAYLGEGERGLNRITKESYTPGYHTGNNVGDAKTIQGNANMFLFRLPSSEIYYNKNIQSNNP